MLAYSVPPVSRRKNPPRRPKLEAYTGVIDRILDEDHRVPRKQRHTAKRIFERLRDEYGFGRRIHRGQGLRQGEPPSDNRDVRAAVPPAGPGPVRLRRGPGGHRRRAAQGSLLRLGSAPQRRLLRQGLSCREHRGLPGRGTFQPSLFLAGFPRASSTTIPSWRWPGYWETANASAHAPSPSCSPTTCSTTLFVRPGKGNDKGKVEGLVVHFCAAPMGRNLPALDRAFCLPVGYVRCSPVTWGDARQSQVTGNMIPVY